ncbi:MAG: UDP-N-acetylmuramoyl-L-alanyl-D-glutamate--2,6-diaminopimelate ligase [Firmicutes bacterium]|nr:UDP-N-acetylmuramoyl-L-alanyl-D-glutamate--2,6-diaminopimelate ligase [Bacillota bacterium]
MRHLVPLGELAGAAGAELRGDPLTPVRGVAFDSRAVEPGQLFACLPGLRADGHDFAPEAVRRGAAALLVERPLPLPLPQLLVRDARRALGRVAAAYWGHPGRRLRVAAVTGTNGKTTIAHLFAACAREAGQPAALVGTLGAWAGGRRLRGPGLTTPESADLQELLAAAEAAGDRWVSLEASSHGLALGRLEGTPVDIAILSQIRRDHFDFHGDFDSYRRAKLRLFTEAGRRDGAPALGAVLNADDPSTPWIAARVRAPLLLYGFSPRAHLRVEEVRELGWGRTLLRLRWRAPGELERHRLDGSAPGRLEVELGLPGRFNVTNALAAAGAALLAGFPAGAVVRALARARPPEGRVESVEMGQPFRVLVDFAHNPAALEALLELPPAPGGRRILVFGAEGGKDPGKRPLMGRAAAERADYVILTSDNPHQEEPEAIARQVERGLLEAAAHPPYEILLDRRKAIRRALELARPGDLVLVAGKGHEREIVGATGAVPFYDVQVVRELLAERAEAGETLLQPS